MGLNLVWWLTRKTTIPEKLKSQKVNDELRTIKAIYNSQDEISNFFRFSKNFDYMLEFPPAIINTCQETIYQISENSGDGERKFLKIENSEIVKS